MTGDFLKPPTDNLYKFMTISGLVLFLVSVTYPPWLVNKTTLSYYENQRDFEVLKIDVEESTERHENLSRQFDSLREERDGLSKLMDDVEKEIDSSQPNPAPNKRISITSKFTRVNELKAKIDEKDRKLTETSTAERGALLAQQKQSIELRYKLEILVWQANSGKALLVLAGLGSIAGLLLARKGFNLWSLRVQVYQDAILKKQAAIETEESGTTDDPK